MPHPIQFEQNGEGLGRTTYMSPFLGAASTLTDVFFEKWSLAFPNYISDMTMAKQKSKGKIVQIYLSELVGRRLVKNAPLRGQVIGSCSELTDLIKEKL